MKTSIRFKTSTSLFLILFVLGCFALPQWARGVIPAPDGGYPNGNTAEGDNSLLSLATGTYNTAVGLNALQSDTIGSRNTAIGVNALRFDIVGTSNTAVGTNALYRNSGSGGNTAVGDSALFNNTIGVGNTAMGLGALLGNGAGQRNTAIGTYALYHNISNSNTAVGYQALVNNNNGFVNTAIGNDSLVSNTTGFENTAIGASALASNVGGQDNTACGSGALSQNISNFNNAFGRNALVRHVNGDGNVAVGDSTLSNDTVGSNNTAIGNSSLLNNIGGSFNIALGVFAGQNITGGNNIDIGAGVTGPGGEDNTIRIGNNNHFQTFIAGIWNQIGGTQAVYVDTDGRLGLQISSCRFKEGIKPMGQTSEVVYSLKPVRFRYKAQVDATRSLSFGLIAEDVEKVSPDLVIRGADGKVNSVRYDAVNAMLLNEFLKEHRRVGEQAREIQQQQSTISELKKKIATVVAHLKEQDSEIQRVSAQVEMTKRSPRTVLNDQ
jgi:hypothetical protein